jgi:WD40 repeat protein
MADVFISYARVNNKDSFINRLADMLKALGKDVWVDWEDIPHGVDYIEEFTKGVDESDTIITVLSPDYLGRPNCMRELNRAIEHNKRIIPLIRLDIDFAQLPEQVRNINAIFIRETDNFEQAFKALVKTIDTDINYVREHTRLLTLAQEWEKADFNRSVLLRGSKLQQAEAWLATSTGKLPRPDDLHTEFILASRHAAIARQRVILGGVTAALVVSIALSVLSFILYQQAETQRVIANDNAATATIAQGEALIQAATAERRALESQSLALAGNAQAASENNQVQAVALGVQASSIERPPAFAQRVLSQVAYAPGVQYLFEGNQGVITKIVFSPDAQTVVTGGEDAEIILWDVETRQPQQKLMGMEGSANDLEISPDGKTVFAGSDLGEIIAWNVEDGEILRRYDANETTSIYQTSLNATGDVLAFVDCLEPDSFGLTCPKTALVAWDVATGEELLRYEDIESGINSLEFSPVTNDLIIGSYTGDLILFDMDEGEILDTVEEAHDGGAITSIAFNPDGTAFATGGDDYYIVTWSLEDDIIEPLEYLYGHNDTVTDVEYSPDGKRLLSASLDFSIVIWDLENAIILETLWAHTSGVLSAAFSPDAQAVLSTDYDSLLFWSDLQSRAFISELVGHTAGVWDTNFSPDGKTAVSIQDQPAGDFDGGIILSDVETGAILERFENELSLGVKADFTQDGKRILSVTTDGIIILWDVATKQPIQVFEDAEVPVFTASLSADERMIASANVDGSISLWDVETGEVIRTVQQHEAETMQVVFTPGNDTVVSVGNDGSVFLWDVETGEIIHNFEGHSGGVGEVEINRLNSTVMTGGSDSTMILWDLDSGARIRTFTGHTGEVVDLDFSPDGQWVASASSDNRVIVWDVNTAEILRVFEGHDDFAFAVDFSPDGTKLISGDQSGKILLWRVDTLDQLIDWTYQNRYVRDLTCEERITFNVPPVCDVNNAPMSTPTATPTP